MSSSSPNLVRLSDPEVMEAHFSYVTAFVREVSVSFGGEHIQGRLGPAEAAGLLSFRPHAAYRGRVVTPTEGKRIRVDYESSGIPYTFRSRIARLVDSGAWALRRPHFIERLDRRAHHRHTVQGSAAFELTLRGCWEGAEARAYAPVDISAEGIAFRFSPREIPIDEGTLLGGELLLPEVGRHPVLLRVANIRTPRRVGGLPNGEPGERIAGGLLVDCSLSDRRLVTLSLSLWQQGS